MHPLIQHTVAGDHVGRMARHEQALERMLGENGVGGPEDISRVRETSHGLGLFVRSDLTPRGPEGLFSSDQVDDLLRLLDGVRAKAVAG